MGDFQERSKGLLDWLNSSGAQVSEKIALEDLRERDAGRGVVAKQDIAEEETLFSIPRHLLLTVENSKLFQEHAEALKLRDMNPWHALIIVMIFEYLRTGTGSDVSPFAPYIRVWPVDEALDTLMFWDKSELGELQASAVIGKIGKKEADQALKEDVVSTIKANEGLFLPAGHPSFTEEMLLSLAHCMGSLIMAYAFDIEAGGDESSDEEDGEEDWEEDEDGEGRQKAVPKGMVPLADMLNADADRNNARLFYEGDALVMKALQPIKAGEEIFNDYGTLPRSDLLRRYGYITPNYAQYDVVEVSHDLIVESAKAGERMSEEDFNDRISYLEEQEVIDTGYDLSHQVPGEPLIESFPMELLVLQATLLLPPGEFQQLKSKDKLPKVKEITPPLAAMLVSAIQQRGAQYPTTIEQDQEILATLKNNRSQKRRKMAVQVRMGEKQILQKLYDALKEIAAQATTGGHKRSAANGPANSNKRVRRA